MTEFVVGAELGPIQVGAKGDTEILQNVRTILTTIKGSVPLDREFGITGNILDQPDPRAQALLSAEIVQAVNRWEPRVIVTQVTWARQGEAADGVLAPQVRIRKADGT